MFVLCVKHYFLYSIPSASCFTLPKCILPWILSITHHTLSMNNLRQSVFTFYWLIIFFVFFVRHFFCMVSYLCFGCASVWISRCFIHLIVLKHFKWVDRREIKALILNTDLYHCAKNFVFKFEKGSECVSRLAASGVMRRLSI